MTGPKNICVGGYDQEGPKHAKREVYCLGRLPYKVTGLLAVPFRQVKYIYNILDLCFLG